MPHGEADVSVLRRTRSPLKRGGTEALLSTTRDQFVDGLGWVRRGAYQHTPEKLSTFGV